MTLDEIKAKAETYLEFPDERRVGGAVSYVSAMLFAQQIQKDATEAQSRALAERLRERARRYQLDNGEPGEMADTWGWRIIAKVLRDEADKIARL
jgi:hypothetical protein